MINNAEKMVKRLFFNEINVDAGEIKKNNNNNVHEFRALLVIETTNSPSRAIFVCRVKFFVKANSILGY